jgi:hypothetical protein
MIEELPQLPVYIVTGSNWTAEVSLDEYNAQFDKEAQMHEAATRAVEAFKFIREDCRILLNPESRNEKPKLGTTLLVHLKGTNPEEAAYILTHDCLGNTGLYAESMKMAKVFDEQVAVLRKRQQEREQREAEIAKDMKAIQAEAKIAEKKSKTKKKPKN